MADAIIGATVDSLGIKFAKFRIEYAVMSDHDPEKAVSLALNDLLLQANERGAFAVVGIRIELSSTGYAYESLAGLQRISYHTAVAYGTCVWA